MNWLGLLAVMVATWCGVDIGIAITKKNTKDIIFNSVIVLFEWAYILFNWGMM
jgi:hypothetical protein